MDKLKRYRLAGNYGLFTLHFLVNKRLTQNCKYHAIGTMQKSISWLCTYHLTIELSLVLGHGGRKEMLLVLGRQEERLPL